ncbi:MAG: hypothetical protein R3B69_00850 [Candidatus Paceibacterota bacterium]
MFGLKKHGPDGRYGAIIDIGSGSVGVGIVVSDPLEEMPRVLWTHREQIVERDTENLKVVEKDITVAIVNAVLELGNTGIQSLRHYDASAKLHDIQVAVSAPWSYTVSQTTTVKKEQPFPVTDHLKAELTQTAIQQVTEKAQQAKEDEHCKVRIVSNATVQLTVNGYTVSQTYNHSATELSLTQLLGVVEERIVSGLEDALEKVLPEIPLQVHTFMYVYSKGLQDLAGDMSHACLVDVTARATEIGTVTGGILKHTTHIPQGTATLAQKIARVCNVTTEEARSYLYESASDITNTLTKTKLEKLAAIDTDYETALTDLLTQTRAVTPVSNIVYLHTEQVFEYYFKERFKHIRTKRSYTIHPTTSSHFSKVESNDTALHLSAYVFHKRLTDVPLQAS